jgi:hypothetical protein
MAKPVPVTDYKDLSKLYTGRIQNRDPARTNLHDIHGVDTETWNGDIFLIADSDGRYQDKITADSVIDFLFHKKFENAWNFFYNIDYDAGVILKLLGNKLNIFKSTGKLHFSYNDFVLDYIPKKRLRISKGHHSRIFFDVAQFFHDSLDGAYQTHIGKLDERYLAMKDKRDQFSPTYYRRNTNAVRQYCINDCIMTKKLAEFWVKIFHDVFLFYPKRWISSGYLAEKVLFNHGIDIPKFNSIPYEIQDLAYRSSVGGRFEILQRGFIGTGYIYDINSAYPNAFSNIPNLNNGKWVKRKSVNPDAKMGFFRILADIPDDKYIPPFPFRANSTVIFPSGKFETYVTLPEILSCENKQWYKILDSYQFIPKNNDLPYREFIETLYEKRNQLKMQNNPMQLPIKIILNAIYGKTGAKTNRVTGNIFNPVIFSHITGYSRAQLYNMVKEHGIERNVVSFATDSIITTKKLDVNSTKLGEFSFDNQADDVHVLQNGIYRFNGKWKKRGFGKVDGKDIEHMDTFVKDGKLFIKYMEKRNTTLKMAIIQNKISDIGKIKPKTKGIDLDADRKRQWFGKLTGIDDSYNNSMPLSLNWISKDKI